MRSRLEPTLDWMKSPCKMCAGSFPQYSKLWAAHLLFQLHEQPFLFPEEHDPILPYNKTILAMLAIILLLFPSNSTLLIATICLRNAVRIAQCPFLWDSEFWLALTDCSVVLSMWLGVPQLGQRWVQKQLAIFYTAAAFFKLNTSFLDHRTSCAPIFVVSLTERLGLLSFLPAKFLASTAPWAVVSWELLVGVTLWFPDPRVGTVLAIVFHTLIAVTPFPNGVPTFSAAAATRLFWVVAAAQQEHTRMEWMVPIAVAFLVGWGMDVAVVAFLAFAGCCVVSLLDWRSNKKTAPVGYSGMTKLVGIGLIGLAFVYAFVFPILGLQEIGSNTMFANMRLHGGSNHILGVPTGLFQYYFHDHDPRSYMGMFAGGIVRVEFTDSVFLNALFPGEITTWLSDASRATLQGAGHVSRQFNPKARRVLGPNIRWNMPRNGDATFVKYTVPAFELRRLLMEARHHAQDTNTTFSLTYTRLSGTVGDEEWRKYSDGVTVSVHDDDGRGNGRCSLRSGEGCNATELAILPSPPYFPLKFLLFYPYAILEEAKGLVCNY